MKGISETFEQELPIAAVGGVVYRQRAGEPELLLIKKHRGFWTLPKGHIKPGETEQDALAREVREETGIGGEIEAVVQQISYTIKKAGQPRRKVVTYYVVRAREDVPRPDAREGIKFVRWFPIRVALRRIRRSRVRAVARAARSMLDASNG
jgi:8-oxo-dGTP diphosphatase